MKSVVSPIFPGTNCHRRCRFRRPRSYSEAVTVRVFLSSEESTQSSRREWPAKQVRRRRRRTRRRRIRRRSRRSSRTATSTGFGPTAADFTSAGLLVSLYDPSSALFWFYILACGGAFFCTFMELLFAILAWVWFVPLILVGGAGLSCEICRER